MDHAARPWRSLLYVPASRGRAMEKARTLACDAVVFDLEDAVAPADKAAAREALVTVLRAGGFGDRARLVRINGAATAWGRADLDAVAAERPDGVVLPKVSGPNDVAQARRSLGEVPVWAMIETPSGVLAAESIAASPGLAGLVVGTNDLAKELGCRERADRAPLMTALQTALLAARSAGVVCIDGVYNAFGDEAGFRAECEQGRDLGMDGKSVIHPAQLLAANSIFAPTEEELDIARRRIAAFEAAQARGQGVAVLDGGMIEGLHVESARRLLARAEVIRAREMA